MWKTERLKLCVYYVFIMFISLFFPIVSLLALPCHGGVPGGCEFVPYYPAPLCPVYPPRISLPVPGPPSPCYCTVPSLTTVGTPQIPVSLAQQPQQMLGMAVPIPLLAMNLPPRMPWQQPWHQSVYPATPQQDLPPLQPSYHLPLSHVHPTAPLAHLPEKHVAEQPLHMNILINAHCRVVKF